MMTDVVTSTPAWGQVGVVMSGKELGRGIQRSPFPESFPFHAMGLTWWAFQQVLDEATQKLKAAAASVSTVGLSRRQWAMHTARQALTESCGIRLGGARSGGLCISCGLPAGDLAIHIACPSFRALWRRGAGWDRWEMLHRLCEEQDWQAMTTCFIPGLPEADATVLGTRVALDLLSSPEDPLPIVGGPGGKPSGDVDVWLPPAVGLMAAIVERSGV